MSIPIREYGHVGATGLSGGLDRQIVSARDAKYLKSVAVQQKGLGEAFALTSNAGHQTVQARNYVGVVALPSGEQLEIVPKTTHGVQAVEQGRQVLLKMLSTVAGLDFRESGLAALKTLKQPWMEALINHVLKSIATVLRSGPRKSYVRVAATQPYLRGQLRVASQLRQRPGCQHIFHVSYDEYSANRPENRLLRSTLEQLGRWSRDANNQRLCRELLFVLDEVPKSEDVSADLKSWSTTRDMIQYKPLLPWVRLVLTNQAPIFSSGKRLGISLMFPMEQLFESYVFEKLKRQMRGSYVLRNQMRSEYLARHRGRRMFRLKPDLVVLRDKRPFAVLDTKWKLIDSSLDDGKHKYGIKESDIYQLFAYGEKYLDGKGELFLVYPAHSLFSKPLSSFSLTDDLRLWAVPFELDADKVRWPNGCDLPFLKESARVAAA